MKKKSYIIFFLIILALIASLSACNFKDNQTITISFHNNGGTGVMSNMEVDINSDVTIIENTFTREGYDFSGWAFSAEGEALAYSGEEYRIGELDIELYAVWTLSPNIIIFHSNNQIDITTNIDIFYGEIIALPFNTFENEGYIFGGWGLTADSEVIFDDGANYTFNIRQDINLYAIWYELKYTVSYNTTNGSGEMSDYLAYEGESLTLTLCNYSYNHRDFCGWATVTGGEVIHLDGAEIEINGDLNLYAVWAIVDYTITLDYNELATNTTLEVQALGQVALPLAEEITGMSFDGWYFDSQYTQSINFPYAIISDHTIYAKYSPLYVVNFYDYDDTLLKTSYVQTGANAEAPSEPTREGYQFDCWNNSYISITSSIDIYAQYNALEYTVTFNSNGGTGTMQDFSVLYETSANLPANLFVRTNYRFLGWSQEALGSAIYEDNGIFTMNLLGVTLYAIWEYGIEYLYCELSNGYTITNVLQGTKMVEIPNTYDDGLNGTAEVLIIGEEAFMNNDVQSVILGENITKVEINAFKGSTVSDITLNEELTEIGNYCFKDCISLTSIIIPSGVDIVGIGIFSGTNTDVYCIRGIEGVGWDTSWDNEMEGIVIWNYTEV